MLTFGQILFRLILAIICGGIIGWERELKAKTAGLRTHVLLCLGSALAMLLAIFFAANRGFGVDVTRIASGVLQGIGLLCVAAVLRYKESVIGLSTSASLWVVAAVGLAIGAGFYNAAIITTIFCLLILTVLAYFEAHYIRKSWPQRLKIKFFNEPDVLKNLLTVIQQEKGLVKIFGFKELSKDGARVIELIVETDGEINQNVLNDLVKTKGVVEVENIHETRF
jgi:putative Mg2+ transporter-C (MgtC) family protein